MQYHFVLKEADNPTGDNVKNEKGVEYRYESREEAEQAIESLGGDYVVAEVGESVPVEETDGGV